MNLLDCTTWIKKLVLLTTLTVVAGVVSFDVRAEAQLNPRPSIFKEYPYRRAQGRKVKRVSNHRPKAKPNTKLKKQGAVQNNHRRPFTQVHKKSPNEPYTIEFRAPGYPSSR